MKFQGPKGTRDFYPGEMSLRNYVQDAWRRVSERNGFEQVDGPIFEPLDLYKVKSGEGIVSELFHFEDRGERELALRPEFTPTLARMVAAKANAMAKPIKWFSAPNLCRAERPQRGRLREFLQWNVDILGLADPLADAECVFTAVDLLAELGLGPGDVRVKISHRHAVRQVLARLGVPEGKMGGAFELLDRRAKMEQQAFEQAAAGVGFDAAGLARFDDLCRLRCPADAGGLEELRGRAGVSEEDLSALRGLSEQLSGFGVSGWCEFDLSIVRGLAYYTGTVFEVHEASGAERAMAGGGRYDGLIELFGGPATPAVGFGMGDVVLLNVLTDRGLLPKQVGRGVDVFVAGATEAGAGRVAGIVAGLRRGGSHARFSYKTTRNLGKLLKEAGDSGARFVVIADDQVSQGVVNLKNLASGEQTQVSIESLHERVGKP